MFKIKQSNLNVEEKENKTYSDKQNQVQTLHDKFIIFFYLKDPQLRYQSYTNIILGYSIIILENSNEKYKQLDLLSNLNIIHYTKTQLVQNLKIPLLNILSTLDKRLLSLDQADETIQSLIPNQSLKISTTTIKMIRQNELPLSTIYQDDPVNNFKDRIQLQYPIEITNFKLHPNTRCHIIDWIVKALMQHQFSSYQCLFQIIALFDQHIHQADQQSTNSLLLLTLACIRLCSKYLDLFSIDQPYITELAGGKVISEDINLMEIKLVKSLNFKLEILTPCIFYSEVMYNLEKTFFTYTTYEDKDLLTGKWMVIKNLGFNYLRLVYSSLFSTQHQTSIVTLTTVFTMFELILANDETYFLTTKYDKQQDFLFIANQIMEVANHYNLTETAIRTMQNSIVLMITSSIEIIGSKQFNLKY